MIERRSSIVALFDEFSNAEANESVLLQFMKIRP